MVRRDEQRAEFRIKLEGSHPPIGSSVRWREAMLPGVAPFSPLSLELYIDNIMISNAAFCWRGSLPPNSRVDPAARHIPVCNLLPDTV